MVKMKLFDLQAQLTEGRDAPLYHGTSSNMALRILDTNELKSVVNEYVSFSRSLSRARSFGRQNSLDSYVVLEFDQAKLAHNNSLQPYNYYADHTNGTDIAQLLGGAKARWSFNGPNSHRNEFEERAKGPIRNISRSLTGIIVSDWKSMDALMKYDKYKPLLNHPLLKYTGAPFGVTLPNGKKV